jgi:hypothetical protein
MSLIVFKSVQILHLIRTDFILVLFLERFKLKSFKIDDADIFI